MSKDEYLLTDTPLKALTVFAMPMILGSFFQQIYNMADSRIEVYLRHGSPIVGIEDRNVGLCASSMAWTAGVYRSSMVNRPRPESRAG